MVVTKVATQGRDGTQMKYVTKYTITWSMDKENWQEYQENDVVKVMILWSFLAPHCACSVAA
jgi:hypothetical protein